MSGTTCMPVYRDADCDICYGSPDGLVASFSHKRINMEIANQVCRGFPFLAHERTNTEALILRITFKENKNG